MNAVLSIELELLEPAKISSADNLLQLHPSQVSWVSIQLISDDDEAPIAFKAQAEDNRQAVQELVAFARKSQPKGTSVKIWYQGRSEQFVI